MQQLEEENTELRTTVTRLKSQTEKLDEVSGRCRRLSGLDLEPNHREAVWPTEAFSF